jgi:hypothetical protein
MRGDGSWARLAIIICHLDATSIAVPLARTLRSNFGFRLYGREGARLSARANQDFPMEESAGVGTAHSRTRTFTRRIGSPVASGASMPPPRTRILLYVAAALAAAALLVIGYGAFWA